jgi:hypothetical protein
MVSKAAVALSTAVLGLACGGAFQAPAFAAENTRISGSFSFVDRKTCHDAVSVAYSYDEQMHIYHDKSEDPTRITFTGKVVIEYTNLSTGATYTPNSSGPGTVDLATGQTTLRGGNGTIFTESGLVATDGRLVLDAGGNVISLVHHETSVCQAVGSTAAS